MPVFMTADFLCLCNRIGFGNKISVDFVKVFLDRFTPLLA